AVRSLVAAVLKEKGSHGPITQSSAQSPALESLWQQCCSDCALVRSVCCDAVVLLVDQGHADLQHILNGALNLLPSANLQGLLKVIGRLLQMQADQREEEADFTCPYSINSPHPYITALENRMDCWPALLLEIDDFIQQAVEKASYITMLAPFLRYLYCEPQQQPQHALLRQSLLRVLLPAHLAARDRDQEKASVVHDSLLLCLCQLVPHMQQLDRVEAALELSAFADALLQNLIRASGEFWSGERSGLLLQLLCACQDLPLDEVLMSVALLLLDAPAAQQSRLLSLVPSLIPVLMFKLTREKNPSMALAVLHCLPNLGTHKFQLCVPMVLQTLQTLASAPKLRAVVMRLMTALWKKQDRVYPELQRLLSQQDSRVAVGKDAEWERVLARAACLRDVCREPYQHGADMLAGISLTLKQCNKADMATPAALALQGLRALCQAEVVDFISTWKHLGAELRCDSRPLMVEAVADLLSLVPQLAVKSDDYEVRPAVKILENEEDNDGNTEEEEEEKDLSIPGSSYMKLMALTSLSVLPALELFLTSLVRQEATQMPRGVYFSALRGAGLRSDQGKTVAGIPSFMLKTYEKNKQPGLKPGLAAGLLLCYELPVQTDREGKPMDRFLVSRGRSYQQTLTALIHEQVNIQPSEWHRALLLPQAWRGFMSRTFHAVLQGRRADLEIQQKRGKEDPEELQYSRHCAWLPVVQGNSILALSSLAAVIAKYESNLPTDGSGSVGAGPEFVPTASWLMMVLDTLLSIISSSYKARGQVFPWFLHRSYSGENTASAIARSCASLALSLLVPVLVVWQKDGLVQVLSALQAGLPGSPAADDSQAVQFHSGLALGMVLSSLHHQRLDVSTQKDKELLLKSLEALESCSFNPDLEYTGCLLGLALVLSAMCSEGQTEQRAYVCRTLDRLLENLQNSGGQGRMLQEVLAYSVACVSVSSFCGGLTDASKAEEAMTTLQALTEESQQTPGFSLALGLVVHGLALSGHGKAEDIFPRLLAAWIKILLAELQGCPTMQRLAAANGLVALVGSESYLIQLQLKSELELTSQQQSRLNEVIRAFTQIVSCSGAIGLQSNTACLLGHLHLAHLSSSHSHTAPQDFSYLSEKSLIRSITDFLVEAGKKPEVAPPVLVRTALTPLALAGGSFQFPPVNWSAVLSPLMRLGFEEVQHQCVVLAAAQAQSSQSASLFLGSWLSPPLVHSLSYRTRAHLYETLGAWMKHVAEDKLQVFVETLGLQQFQDDLRPRRLSLCSSLLRGLASAMALPNPRRAGWTLLCSAAEKIFNLLPDKEVDLYVGVAKCLSEMNDSEIDRIAGVSEMEKTAFILAYLASRGRVPLLGLNDVIAGVLRGWPRHRVGWLLLQAFYQCRLSPSSNTVSKRMEWLQELMGHIRNVAYGAATDFLFQLFAAAVVCWADHRMPLLLGIRTQWFPWQPEPTPPLLTHSLYGVDVQADHALQQCLLGVCYSLPVLLDKEPWSSQTPKFIDWLLSIADGPDHRLSAATVRTAKALLALKSSTEFRRKAVWTQAYGW
uniref:Focadhesin n=1 Tax=Oryzias latipes TaxID=8090 RepID=A0A3P9HUQ4_ORYLA